MKIISSEGSSHKGPFAHVEYKWIVLSVTTIGALKAALLLIPLSLVSMIMAPVSGMIADRIGARLPATLGLLIQAGALAWLMQITATTPYLQIAGGLALMGLGGGLFYAPNTSAAMNAAPSNAWESLPLRWQPCARRAW